MEFTDAELSMLKDELDERADTYHHYPDECSDLQEFYALHQKIYDECKRRGKAGSERFWWAR